MDERKSDSRPIGVFDSGIGGLTVAASIRRLLPGEDIAYFGDLLHLPYGSKSPEAILEFSRAAAAFLIAQRVKLLVIACNTATSVAMAEIEREADVPVIGVIRPGALAACAVSGNRRIGVIGTARTVESGAYRAALEAVDPAVSVFQKATPLLVPLIEEGWTAHPVMRSVLAEYFRAFEGTSIDTLVLGCTHYPLIRPQVESLMEKLSVVDSAATTAESVRALLEEKGGMNRGGARGSTSIYLTDYTETFREIGERILGGKGFDPRVVNLSYAHGKVTYV